MCALLLLFIDADRDVRRAVPAIRRLLRAERDAAVRVQRQARGVRAQRQHEPVREVRTGPGGERDLRPGGAADKGGDRGGSGQARRRRVRRRCRHVASGRGDGGRTAAQLWGRLPGRGGLARARRTAAAVRGGAAARNVQEPVRRHHGRRRGQDASLQKQQQQQPQ